MLSDRLKEECGIFGIFSHPNAAHITYLGLYALQHRGQESSGIASTDGKQCFLFKNKGSVHDVFNQEDIIDKYLKGDTAIGHNRYSTTGSNSIENIQPLVINFKKGQLAIAHNGNLTNTYTLRREMENNGSIFQTTMDSEVILHLIARSTQNTLPEMISDALQKISGAFSLLFMTPDCIIAARDPYGFRPLSIGKLDDGVVIASESCAFDIINAEYIRDVEPGEIIVIEKDSIKSYFPFSQRVSQYCIFEYIYFARPDSLIFGEYVDVVRRKMGRQLAIDHPADADIVISVPDSSNSAALGFAQQLNIPFEFGLIRNHYIGRTFIHPTQIKREFGVKIKFNPLVPVLKGKRVVMVDDSIVRGTTSKKIIRMVKEAGALEVHFRISSPPFNNPCFYGVDTPDRDKLIASSYSIEEIRKFMGAESLGYLSMEGMFKAITHLKQENFCTACFNGKYPIIPELNFSKEKIIQPQIYFS